MRLGVSVLVFENGEARIGLAIFEHVMDYVNIGKRLDICIFLRRDLPKCHACGV